MDWVAHHKIDHYFNAIVGIENDAADGKTDAGLNWLSKVDSNKKEILLVGDTIHDSDVAEQMGVHCDFHRRIEGLIGVARRQIAV